jgi:4-amino-4-deoxy-L-arabinose transferase-like glycosyltransferase
MPKELKKKTVKATKTTPFKKASPEKRSWWTPDTISNILFIFILAIAAFLRLYRIKEFVTFLGDQGRDAIIVKRIVTFEHLTAIGPPSSIGQVFLGPFYYYLIAPFLPIFHYDPVGLAVGVAVYSLIGLIGMYIVLKKEINLLTAIFTTLLVALSSFSVTFQRFSWNPNLLPFFAFFTLYFFYKTLETKKWQFGLLTGIFFSASFQLHHLGLLLCAPIAVYLVIFLRKNKIDFTLIRNMLAAVAGFIVLAFPLILFDIKNHFLNTINFIKTFTSEGVLASTPPVQRFLDTVTAAMNFALNITLPQWAAVLLFITFVAVCIYFYRQSKNVFLHINILNAVLYILMFSLLNSARNIHYFGVFYFSFYLILGYGLYYLQKNKYLRFTIVPLLLAGFIYLNAQGYYFFKNVPNNQIHDADRIADSIIAHLDKDKTFQIVPLPITVTDHHIRYFLELKGHKSFEVDSPQEPDELFALCFYNNDCQILGNPQWQIAAFKNGKIAESWKLDIVTIYKVVHEKE